MMVVASSGRPPSRFAMKCSANLSSHHHHRLQPARVIIPNRVSRRCHLRTARGDNLFHRPQSEADPAAIYIQLLTAFGNYVGRKPVRRVEKTRHHPNIFAVLVGKTNLGLKGTSLDYIKELLKLADPLYSEQIDSGLSTGEGLIWKVRDPIFAFQYDKKSKASERIMIDEGVKDKRLLLTEAEFARPLRAMSRTSNILNRAAQCLGR